MTCVDTSLRSFQCDALANYEYFSVRSGCDANDITGRRCFDRFGNGSKFSGRSDVEYATMVHLLEHGFANSVWCWCWFFFSHCENFAGTGTARFARTRKKNRNAGDEPTEKIYGIGESSKIKWTLSMPLLDTHTVQYTMHNHRTQFAQSIQCKIIARNLLSHITSFIRS